MMTLNQKKVTEDKNSFSIKNVIKLIQSYVIFLIKISLVDPVFV